MTKPSTVIKAISEGWVRGALKSYIFTCEGADTDLDGVPARIFEVNDFGDYVLHFIEGSTLVVAPRQVRMLD